MEAALRRRGADVESARDAAQEAAMRALVRLGTGHGFDSERGLRRWCHTVAGRHLVDRWRRQRREVGLAAAPLVVVDDEVSAWRLLTAEAVVAFGALSPEQHRAVIDHLNGVRYDDKRERDRESLRRMRARDRLREAIGGLPVVWPWRRLRWLGGLTPVTVMTGSFLVVGVVMATSGPGPVDATVVGFATSDEGGKPVSPQVGAHQPVAPPMRPRPDHVHRKDGPTPAAREEAPVVRLAGPTGGTEIGTTANDPDDPMLCVETVATEPVCLAKPGSPSTGRRPA